MSCLSLDYWLLVITNVRTFWMSLLSILRTYTLHRLRHFSIDFWISSLISSSSRVLILSGINLLSSLLVLDLLTSTRSYSSSHIFEVHRIVMLLLLLLGSVMCVSSERGALDSYLSDISSSLELSSAWSLKLSSSSTIPFTLYHLRTRYLFWFLSYLEWSWSCTNYCVGTELLLH